MSILRRHFKLWDLGNGSAHAGCYEANDQSGK